MFKPYSFLTSFDHFKLNKEDKVVCSHLIVLHETKKKKGKAGKERRELKHFRWKLYFIMDPMPTCVLISVWGLCVYVCVTI